MGGHPNNITGQKRSVFKEPHWDRGDQNWTINKRKVTRRSGNQLQKICFLSNHCITNFIEYIIGVVAIVLKANDLAPVVMVIRWVA